MSSAGSDPPRDFADRFRVESRLGRGGMGDVYKAYDTVLERTVAVKTLTPGNAGAEAVERLLREARACARLTHPGIVTIHDVLQVDGSVHIVMEHLEGASLASLHRFARMSTLEGKIDVIVRILDALHYAHGRGVVHRDIKPTNVQILPDGSVKLLDFGIAHVAGAAALTATGIVTGTVHYASPEQLRGEESDARADVYSTGILAYEVLTRRRPFDGDSIATVLTKVLNHPLPPMATSLSERFPDIERIVRRATAKRSQDRYPGAEDMKNALAAFLASSREAIVTWQAEVSARTERLIVEARSLITGGRSAEAMPLLTSLLRENPDAEKARELLHSAAGASIAAPEAPAAPPESTVRVPPDRSTAVSARAAETVSESMSADRPTTVSTSIAEGSTVLHAATESTAAAPSWPWSGRRLQLAGAVLILLVAVVVLGLRWISPGAPADATPAAAVTLAIEPRPGVVGAGTETPDAPAADALAADPPASARAEEPTGGAREPTGGAREPTGGAREPTGGPRRSGRDAVEASGPAPAAASPPAPATRPAVRTASSVEPPPTSIPDAGAKDLYYATTPSGPAASTGSEATPVPVAADGPVNPGLKYRILRRGLDGDAVEVDADTMFRSGDRIRFAFEPNVDGFLYVVQRGSTGRWSVLLPHPLIDGGRNAVTRFGEVTIPPDRWLVFDENPGSEEVFVYLSREPIDTLPWGGGSVVSAQSVDQPTVIELANSVRSRDLVFEKEDTPEDADPAAYVVNQDAVGQAVAWTVELHHR